MSNQTKNATQIIDAVTRIGGPSHEELLRPFQKSADEIARDQRREHENLVREFNAGGSK